MNLSRYVSSTTMKINFCNLGKKAILNKTQLIRLKKGESVEFNTVWTVFHHFHSLW